ncbi:MAG: GerW family sporulation protein [Oscillospiraceae bacterium]|jgi:sporulation protein YtfJ|nr:GerW family sporulation protein [Oscillospiraceae bacterium]
MDKHPIQSLMSTTMENIKDMVDVNTVVGDPVTAGDGTTIIPISRVSFGFVSGGGEYAGAREDSARDAGGAANYSNDEMPFAGGTGAGVSVHPMGFLVVGQGQVKMLPTNYATPVDRVMELLPQVIGEVKDIFQENSQSQAVSGGAAAATTPRHSKSIPITGRTIGSGLDKDLPIYTNNNNYNDSFTHPGKPVVSDPVSGSHMANSSYNARYDNKADNTRFDGKYDTKADAKTKLDTKFDTKANTDLNGSSSATVTNSVNASSMGKNT